MMEMKMMKTTVRSAPDGSDNEPQSLEGEAGNSKLGFCSCACPRQADLLRQPCFLDGVVQLLQALHFTALQESHLEGGYSGTDTEFYVPDLWSQAAIMAKKRAFLLNPDLFRTIF